jgi:hypothetical protein
MNIEFEREPIPAPPINNTECFTLGPLQAFISFRIRVPVAFAKLWSRILHRTVV